MVSIVGVSLVHAFNLYQFNCKSLSIDDVLSFHEFKLSVCQRLLKGPAEQTVASVVVECKSREIFLKAMTHYLRPLAEHPDVGKDAPKRMRCDGHCEHFQKCRLSVFCHGCMLEGKNRAFCHAPGCNTKGRCMTKHVFDVAQGLGLFQCDIDEDDVDSEPAVSDGGRYEGGEGGERDEGYGRGDGEEVFEEGNEGGSEEEKGESGND